MGNTNNENFPKLSFGEHIQIRPTMYIGRLGDGALPDDGLYVMLKEVVNNAVDELENKSNSQIEVDLMNEHRITIRDNGNGIALDNLTQCLDVVESNAFYPIGKKSIGLHGLGLRIVNGLSSYLEVRSYHGGKVRTVIYEYGLLKEDITKSTDESNGLYVSFEPNIALFKDYRFHEDILIDMLRHYSYLNTGLSIKYNGLQMLSFNGLADMLHDDVKSEAIYPIIHFIGYDIEIAFTHTYRSGRTIYSYVNKHYTPLGGTHQEAFEKHFIKTMKRVYGRKKNDAILYGLVAAIAIRVDDPIFDSSTKVKLASHIMEENGVSIDTYIGDFLEKHLYDYLCAHPDVSSTIKSTINEYK